MILFLLLTDIVDSVVLHSDAHFQLEMSAMRAQSPFSSQTLPTAARSYLV